MGDPLLIYGATGYSGRLLAQAAVAAGLQPVLAGRDARALAAVAEPLGLAHRAVGLDDAAALGRALAKVRVVVHAAGPFARTAPCMVAACIAAGAHYLDITGEVRVVEALVRMDAAARHARVMVMPGAGFEVVPSDCLAAHVARRLPGADRLAIALAGFAAVSRGSARTLFATLDHGVVRRGGTLVPVPLGSIERQFDYGAGARASVNVSWADLVTAYHTTGIPNIETFVAATPLVTGVLRACRAAGWLLGTPPAQAWLDACAGLLPPGPTAAERSARRMTIVAEAQDRLGRRAVARLATPEAYAFTATAALALAERALGGDVEPGFQTPARVYGSDFVLGLPGVVREDVA